jgi:hypothetical protein
VPCSAFCGAKLCDLLKQLAESKAHHVKLSGLPDAVQVLRRLSIEQIADVSDAVADE